MVKSGISVGSLSSSRSMQSLQSRITKDNFLNSRFTENRIKKSRITTISPGTTLYLVKKTHERDQRGNVVYTNPGTTNDGNGMTVLNIFSKLKKQEMKSFHFRNVIRVILSFSLCLCLLLLSFLDGALFQRAVFSIISRVKTA